MTRLARCRSVAIVGVRGTVVDIEVHIGGMPGFSLVGLPDASLYESRDRVRAAVMSSRESWPLQRITVSLSPAALPKRGSHFDLGVAVAILAAAEEVPLASLDGVLFLGELALDGRLRPIRGVLPAVLAGERAGLTRAVVPETNAAEARLIPGIRVFGARSLRQVLAFLRGTEIPDEARDELDGTADVLVPAADDRLDLADVAGQPEARRAVEIAAAGHHHLLLSGTPGSGKTMLARRLPSLLPDLSVDESLEVTSIHSIAGALPPGRPLIVRPPFVDPHHTSSIVSIVGGGSRVPLPGAASLAHRGILFLDEAPEFQPRVLDSLRQPLESGTLTLARSEAASVFPARFLLVMAQNPCPCGYFGSPIRECTCKPDAVRRYGHRLSGPVRDRVDIHVGVDAPTMAELDADAEPSKVVADRVAEARARQERRLRGTPWRCNGELPGPFLRRELKLPAAVTAPAYEAVRKGSLTLRGVDRVLRVAWTVADLAGRDRPTADDVRFAVDLRQGGTT
ncbi:YifB family Mg chelatase-like AAA ATPase [Jiangella rhizosphaerae]|uniref:ATP-binding protein n=1 Tax=Jiangella rhizosphaerae TaxID=2293569 RepID=A0A418KWA3_9ACTN|nr:YifB family Mg chelatase-like AAA ATPase [Jiangella rhizosphaerae]RIQ34945.1 ATP-binding protein [Jiangella rhizosphaerae]